MEKDIRNAFLRLMKHAMGDAQRAYRCIFAEAKGIEDLPFGEGIHKNSMAALSYASSSIGRCSAAMAIYYNNLEELEHAELPELFHLFDVYVQELQKNCATNHSHQWTGIEFDSLQEAFENSICVEPLTE